MSARAPVGQEEKARRATYVVCNKAVRESWSGAVGRARQTWGMTDRRTASRPTLGALVVAVLVVVIGLTSTACISGA